MILKCLWDARSEWYMIGIALEVNLDELHEIESREYGSSEKCLSRMLNSWLRQTSPLPTWSKLIEALRSPGVCYLNMAEELSAGLNWSGHSGEETSPQGT